MILFHNLAQQMNKKYRNNHYKKHNNLSENSYYNMIREKNYYCVAIFQYNENKIIEGQQKMDYQ